MPPARVLWVADPERRPDDVRSVRLLTAETLTAARETIETLSRAGDHLDAVVAAPALPDGDGSAVLRAVRDRWPDAACFLHGDLWAIPEGSSLPVCEFHPTGQTASDVAGAVDEAVLGRYHRAYPVPDEEDRRLDVLSAIDFEAARAELGRVTSAAESEAGATIALVSVVDDHTVWVAAASDDPELDVLPRGDSPCTYTIAESATTVIEDLASDGRFAHVDRPCAVGVRSYAARPLTVDDAPVGTLALFDEDPGGFSEIQLETLSRSAAAARRALESAR